MAKKKTKSKRQIFGEQFGYQNADFLESGFSNNVTFLDFYLQYQNDIMSMFEWTGLPDTVDERFLELQLFLTGYVIFFKEKVSGAFLCLGGALSQPNIYGNMLVRRPVAMNGEQFGNYTNEDSVIIYNNMTRTASCVTCQNYSLRLEKILRTIDVNLNTMKTPFIVKVNKNNELAIKNAMMKYDGNQPVIYVDDEQSLTDCLKVLDLSIDPRITELNDYYKEVMAQGLTNQGIPVSASDKKERLLGAEVNTNNAQNLLIADGKLKTRKEACDVINRKWGLNVDVDYSDTYRQFLEDYGEGGLMSVYGNSTENSTELSNQ